MKTLLPYLCCLAVALLVLLPVIFADRSTVQTSSTNVSQPVEPAKEILPPPVEPQLVPEAPSWHKPPKVTLPLEELDDTFSHAFLAWNVQSVESDARVIADQLKQLAGYDIYCLNEVFRRSFPIYRAALPD